VRKFSGIGNKNAYEKRQERVRSEASLVGQRGRNKKKETTISSALKKTAATPIGKTREMRNPWGWGSKTWGEKRGVGAGMSGGMFNSRDGLRTEDQNKRGGTIMKKERRQKSTEKRVS